ncbi:flavo protein [Pseudovirgaria hyperparasitica]|uniref:Flavo protein n=1 Tax=Pseudovirgaria hyperparasitica TaxID=470096 RepID=A0A6A6W5L0_9PEZI|nr:flavo protein [Pseudovirgaria hyperparasitica]KAF2756847.1 flavo protein [Pseudovirgaria hyperparasitica]
MHILGLANGTPAGNSEILLKAALSAATQARESISASWIHLPSLSIPLDGGPLPGAQDISLGANASLKSSTTTKDPAADDRRALLDAILDADALIFSTPVYSHTPRGSLKAIFDTIVGPSTDAVFAARCLERQKAGDPRFEDVQIDGRLFKPRVVGFICSAGSTTPDQVSLALPTLHLCVYSFHAKVVDQMVVYGVGAPGFVVAKVGGAELCRAEELGRNIASEIGKGFDEARYLGPKSRGACLYCHLSTIEVLDTGENEIMCATCGAQGKLAVGIDGVIGPMWKEDDQRRGAKMG